MLQINDYDDVRSQTLSVCHSARSQPVLSSPTLNPFPANPELTRPGIVATFAVRKSTPLRWPLQLIRNPTWVVYPRRNDSHYIVISR